MKVDGDIIELDDGTTAKITKKFYDRDISCSVGDRIWVEMLHAGETWSNGIIVLLVERL